MTRLATAPLRAVSGGVTLAVPILIAFCIVLMNCASLYYFTLEHRDF